MRVCVCVCVCVNVRARVRACARPCAAAVSGNPAIVRGANVVGLRRKGEIRESEDSIDLSSH